MSITKDHGVRVREAGVQNSRNFLSQSWRGRLTTGLFLSLCRFVWTLVYCVSMAMCLYECLYMSIVCAHTHMCACLCNSLPHPAAQVVHEYCVYTRAHVCMCACACVHVSVTTSPIPPPRCRSFLSHPWCTRLAPGKAGSEATQREARALCSYCSSLQCAGP